MRRNRLAIAITIAVTLVVRAIPRIVAALLLVLVAASHAMAEPPSSIRQQLEIQAKRKLLAGAVLVATGLVILPVTAALAQSNSRPVPASRAVGGLAITAVGTGLLWSGAQDRRRAAQQPEIAFSVIVGRETGIAIQRRW
jgi:hypothetical protein